ncbi:MAG: DEAD/DEAH box helicase [Candidatus Thorarchaeota archaeon]|nr:DEAD/DEAH box helicase [Candidatus Thorarchaeota archaeon]
MVVRKTKQEWTLRVEIFSDVLRDRQLASFAGRMEFGRKSSGLLEIRKSWFVKYNKPVYIRPKNFRDILRKAEHLIIPRQQQPSFTSELKSYLERIQAPDPKIVPVCVNCLREKRLTILSRRNAVKTASEQVMCLACAGKELKIDISSLGINLSKRMEQYLLNRLAKTKSVPDIVKMISPGFDPASDPSLTKVDELEAGEAIEGRAVEKLPIPGKLKGVLKKEGLTKLLPVQEIAVQGGLFDNEDMMIVSSTSSGKTLIGELAGIPKALAGKKMLYLSPLVALTNEKYERFKRRYRQLGLRVGIRVGMSRIEVGDEGKVIVDTDVAKADVISATYEALDLVLRSGNADELGDIGTIIIDEIQNLAEQERGPELDGLLNRLEMYAPNAQKLALSATVGAPSNLADELRLKLVEYTGRPVPLERHLVFATDDKDKWRIVRRLVSAEFRTTSSAGKKGQSIVFTFSRKRCHRISDWLNEHGVSSAVYHGGLSYYERRKIEKSYSQQRYACVVTTAALGAGVDLPASQVIFESLAMGAKWLSTADFEQMLGRAGRLGKHDRGKVYLVVQPERKYHGGQDLTEDEIASDVLRGEIEEVEPFANMERSAEQILATICAAEGMELKATARHYSQLLSASVPPSDALKHLVKRRMIHVRDGKAIPTDLGLATSVSFLTPSEGMDVLRKSERMDPLEIAVMLDPFENVYFSKKVQKEINSAFRTHMPTRFFSGVFLDISDVGAEHGGASRLSRWMFELFGRWTREFFKCKCPDAPECGHPKIEFGKWVVEKRKQGLNPSDITRKLLKEYELWVYPGDMLSWLDTVIHNLQAVQRISKVAGKTDLESAIDDQIARIEKPLEDKDK